MKRLILAVALAALAVPAFAANVGVSINIGAPGYYGPIDLQGYPQPAVVYPQPIVVQPPPPGVIVQPLYLRVPPGHAKHWDKHCGRYHACGAPVYFVQDGWYRDVYAPNYHGHGHEHGEGHGHHHHDD